MWEHLQFACPENDVESLSYFSFRPNYFGPKGSHLKNCMIAFPQNNLSNSSGSKCLRVLSCGFQVLAKLLGWSAWSTQLGYLWLPRVQGSVAAVRGSVSRLLVFVRTPEQSTCVYS